MKILVPGIQLPAKGNKIFSFRRKNNDKQPY